MERPRSDWLTVTEVCRRLGVPRRTLFRLIDRAELPAYKIGHWIRLRVSDVEAYERRTPLPRVVPPVRGVQVFVTDSGSVTITPSGNRVTGSFTIHAKRFDVFPPLTPDMIGEADDADRVGQRTRHDQRDVRCRAPLVVRGQTRFEAF